MRTLLHPLHLLDLYANPISSVLAEEHPAHRLDDLHGQMWTLQETLYCKASDADERGDTDSCERLEQAAEQAIEAERHLEILAYDIGFVEDPEDDSRRAHQAHTHLAEVVRLAQLTPTPGEIPKLDSPEPPPNTPEGQAPRGTCMHCRTETDLHALPQEAWEGALSRHMWLCTPCHQRASALRDEYRRITGDLDAIGRSCDPWPTR